MRQLRFNLVLIAFLFVTTGCCKRGDNILVKPLTEKEKLLSAHGWHESLIIEDGVPHEVTAPWSVDDCWFFYNNRTFIYSLGTLLRPPGPGENPEQNSSGTWELNENETELIWTTNKPYNAQLSYPIKIQSDTMILTIITQDVNRLRVYTNCK
jgi:hypothetical protein